MIDTVLAVQKRGRSGTGKREERARRDKEKKGEGGGGKGEILVENGNGLRIIERDTVRGRAPLLAYERTLRGHSVRAIIALSFKLTLIWAEFRAARETQRGRDPKRAGSVDPPPRAS